MKKKQDLKVVSFSITPVMHEELQNLSALNAMSVSEFLRKVYSEWKENYGQQKT